MQADEIYSEFEGMDAEERAAMLGTLITTWCPECGETHEDCVCEDSGELAEDDG
jgi:hypothetical protein